mgnify:CR=1 FL=1
MHAIVTESISQVALTDKEQSYNTLNGSVYCSSATVRPSRSTYAAGEGDVIVAIIVAPTQTFSRTPEFLLFETRLVGCNEKATDLC